MDNTRILPLYLELFNGEQSNEIHSDVTQKSLSIFVYATHKHMGQD